MDRQITIKKLLIFLFCLFMASIALSELTNPLPPEQAFNLQVEYNDDQGYQLSFQIAPEHYLYKKHFEFKTLDGKPLQPTTPMPKGIKQSDAYLGEYEVYANELNLSLPNEPQGFRIQYQGCTSAGFCYLPITKSITRTPAGEISFNNLSPKEFQVRTVSYNPLPPSKTTQIIDHLKTGSYSINFLFFLGLGMLLALTPCILPMIPIMANLILGNTQLSKYRSFFLASVYILTMALCYAIAGTLAGLIGSQIQQALQQPIPLILLGVFFALLALDQWELINLRLFNANITSRWQSPFRSGTIPGAITMGILTALMLSPCVTPAFVGSLTYIGQTGNAALGGMALFALGIGMGLPLLGVAFLGKQFLPKAGPWIKKIKWVVGLLLLLLSASLFLRAYPLLQTDTNATRIHTREELDNALLIAKYDEKPALLLVHADWCLECQHLKHFVFQDPSVKEALETMTFLQLDVTKQNEANDLLQECLHILGPPTILFFDRNGKEISDYRLVGNIGTKPFKNHLEHFSQSYKKSKKQ